MTPNTTIVACSSSPLTSAIAGEDIALLARRHALYQAAKAEHPERWSGATRNWEPAIKVLLNPGKPLKAEHQTEAMTVTNTRSSSTL